MCCAYQFLLYANTIGDIPRMPVVPHLIIIIMCELVLKFMSSSVLMFWYVYLAPTLESNIESNELMSLLQVNCACLVSLHNAVIIRLVIGCVAGFLLLGDT